jgi:DNA-binding MarR family transcriptional regulator
MLPDSTPDQRAQRLWQALGACDAARDRRLVLPLATLGVTPPQARLLQALASGPRGLGELAGMLGVTRANVTFLVGKLARAGLLLRTSNTPDRRAATAHLTAAGERLAGLAHQATLACETRLADGLTPDEQEILTRLLGKLHTTGLAHDVLM